MALGFGSYEIARSGLFVSERGLYVTGHNISNVNTPGYVRQQAMICDSGYQTGYTRNGLLQVGQGADIQQVRQIRHIFLDGIYRQESATLGYWESRAKTFQDIEAILDEPLGSGLQDMMNKFYDAWQELSKEPDSLTIRALVRQRAEALVNHVNHIGEQLDRLQNDLNSELKIRIGEVNDITAQIAKLNAQIMQVEATGDNANDYRDQRNLLLDRLSKLADVQVMELQDGQVNITLGGYTLVSKDVHKNLIAAERQPGDIFYVPKLEGTDTVVPVSNGIIKGLMDARGEASGASGSTYNENISSISDLRQKLNTLINAMVSEINSLHKSGKTLGDPPSDGEDFFTVKYPDLPLEMGNIKLNDIFSDLNKIVASESGKNSDNTVALKIANLRHKPLITDATGTMTLDEYYQWIIQKVGHSGSEAISICENQQLLIDQADASRQAILAVSMDEEMANMMKFKYAYNASSRAINIIDSMIETIITKMGLVGR